MSGLTFAWLLLAVPPAAVVAIFVVHRRRTAAKRDAREARFKALFEDPPATPAVSPATPAVPGTVTPAAVITPARYSRRSAALSAEAAALFQALLDAFPDHWVLSNVPLVDLLDVGPTGAEPSRDGDLRELSVQFVLCGPDGVPLGACDSGSGAAVQADLKARYLEAAGLRYVLVSMRPSAPDVATLRTRLGKNGG